ncbi:MAG: S1 RNA-binding domain-containing protein [Treponema sp.]|nr:S1 RNA-binding domain-containing protein [Treponema sp.]
MKHAFEIGQQIEAAIVAISGDTIFLNLNLKSEGVLDATELKKEDGTLSVKEGDVIKAFFVGEIDGEMRFTTKIAGEKADKSMLENAWKNAIPVEGHVEKEIKGGFEVKIGSSRAFCPYSQMGGRNKGEPSEFVGKHLTFLIQEYKEDGKNLLVSNRAILEIEHKKEVGKLENSLKVGMTVKATVISLQTFGAFVSIQGFQALLPISEISRTRVTDIEKELSVGQELTVKIINADWAHERVSVSLKALIADPWDTVQEKYIVGKKYEGTIIRIAQFGLFVQLEPGLDGLVHISEMTDIDRNTNLAKLFKTGTKMSVIIKEVNRSEKRIALTPTSSQEQDLSAAKYMADHNDDDDGYNPFAALLKR